MKLFKLSRINLLVFLITICLIVTGCNDDTTTGSSSSGIPASIEGTWTGTMTGGTNTWVFSITITQTDTTVTGTYYISETSNVYNYAGIYTNGTMEAVDQDRYFLQIQFTGNSGSGILRGGGVDYALSITKQ